MGLPLRSRHVCRFHSTRAYVQRKNVIQSLETHINGTQGFTLQQDL